MIDLQAEHAIARSVAQDQQSAMSNGSNFPTLAATRASAAQHSDSGGSEGFASDNDDMLADNDDAVSNYSDDEFAPTEVTNMFNHLNQRVSTAFRSCSCGKLTHRTQ
jgi:hypothetical protein